MQSVTIVDQLMRHRSITVLLLSQIIWQAGIPEMKLWFVFVRNPWAA